MCVYCLCEGSCKKEGTHNVYNDNDRTINAVKTDDNSVVVINM